MKIYKTKQGDTWDLIAYTQMGSTKYTNKLMSVNLHCRNYYIFPAGKSIQIPDISDEDTATRPPWKQANK